MERVRLSGKWTPEERIRVAVALLGSIQCDIPEGRYSAPGRPNITSVLGFLVWPAEDLAQYTAEAETLLDEAVSTMESNQEVQAWIRAKRD